MAAGLATAIIAAVFCPLQPGCQGKQENAAPRAIPVSVSKSVCKPMPVELKTFGTVEAYATVSVRSLVTGELRKVHIIPGQYVDGPRGKSPGTLLFTIDPRPFQAAYDKAAADLKSSQASASDARRRADELKRLYDAHAGAYDEMRTAQAIADALEAKVSADLAAVEQTSLNLDYASIESSIDGRAGDILVKEGNLVKANDDVLVTITKTKPIYVSFSAPQSYLPIIRERMAKEEMEVLAIVKCPDKKDRVDKGILTFINNTVDTSTGTILLKATFKNVKELLWPGQFVNVTLILGIQPKAVVVPAQAVQVGQKGQYVYVVGSDNKVQPVFITVDREVGEEAVISSGLEAGQTIVTDGQLKLFPGALVKPEQAAMPPTTTAAEDESAATAATAESQPKKTGALPPPDSRSSPMTNAASPQTAPSIIESTPPAEDIASQPMENVSSKPMGVDMSTTRSSSIVRPSASTSGTSANDDRKPLDNEESPRPAVKRPAQGLAN